MQRRIYAHTKARHVLAHSLHRLGQHYSDWRAAWGGRARLVRRAGRGSRHALDSREPAASVLLRAFLLPLARRACFGHPVHRLRPTRHEPPTALTARRALGVLPPSLNEPSHRSLI